jgi:hypothetical protein
MAQIPCHKAQASLLVARRAKTTLPIPMNANEEAGLKNSAEMIRATIRSLGF